MLNETKKRESRLAELEDKINDLTELCSQLEKEKVNEMEKNIASQRIIDQVKILCYLRDDWGIQPVFNSSYLTP